MRLQPADDDLDQYEAWARACLAPLLWAAAAGRPVRGPEGLHDFEADLADGSVAALEVTGEVDARRRSLAASAERRLASVTLPGSKSLWLVGLAPGAQVRVICRSKLRRLLGELEAGGRRHAHDRGDYRDPFVARLVALGVESVYAVTANARHEGAARVGPGSYGGWGWDGPAIDRWLGEVLASGRGANKLGKPGRAAAAQRHLVVVLDPFSQAGLGITLALTARHDRGLADYALPALVPPEPLTHVWLLPAPVETLEGLGWTRDGGWTVLAAWCLPRAL